MKRSRSALSRHRKRKLLEATLHVSGVPELSVIAELAGAASIAQLLRQDREAGLATEDADTIGGSFGGETLNQVVAVLRNVKNSVYHRAMAARALGLLMLHDPAGVAQRLALESEDLLDALLQLVNCSRRFETSNADTRRVHVNCCLAISLLMRATQSQPQLAASADQRLPLVVSLDSALLAMPPRPTERSSGVLLLTVSGRPESCVGDRPSVSLGPSDGEKRKPLKPIRAAALPPARPCSSNAASPTKSTALDSKRQPSKPPRLPPPAMATTHTRDEEDAPLAPSIERRQTPSRQFKMDRFRVVTPALVSSSMAQRARSKPLPMISPSRAQMRPDGTAAQPQASGSNQSDSFSPREGIADGGSTPAPPSSCVPSPPTLLSAPPTASALLSANHMVEILRTGRMPVASARVFSDHLRDDDPPLATPSRLSVVEWGDWRRRALSGGSGESAAAEALLPPLVGAAEPPPLPRHPRAGGSSHSHSHSSGSVRGGGAVENIHTPEYKRERLREILSSPIEPLERNTAQLLALQRHASTATMAALDAALSGLREGEARTRQQTRTMIERERDRLPLKFLFQLPGGAAYCRERMRQAMRLWVSEFEANQKRMALLQWKAFVEQGRFRARRQTYHRLAVEKRLRVAVAFVLRGYQQQGFTKWVDTVQLAIWSDRDAAVRTIQRQVRRRFGLRRFLRRHDAFPVGGPFLRDVDLVPPRDADVARFRIPDRVRLERRRIWAAAELVQGVSRKRRFRTFLKRYRVAATKIQARARMRIRRTEYRTLRTRIVLFQACARMQRHFRAFQSLRRAAVLVQINFRCVRIKRMRQLVVQAQRREAEWRLTSALRIQRVARGFLGRRAARRREFERDEAFHAALVVQRAWYRRNKEWSTFLLLGCLREKEKEETAFDRQVLAFTRRFMAKQIRHAWRHHRHRGRTRAASLLQRNVRRWLATRVVERLRLERMAHRRIKWFFRFRHAHRVETATRLQFWWLRAAPGRLAAHLRHRRLAMEAAARQRRYEQDQRAATRLQSAARGSRARRLAHKERSARAIQRAARAFLTWRRIKRAIRRIQAAFADAQARRWVREARDRVFVSTMARLDAAATQIQRFTRGGLWRARLTRLLVESELRERMARRIQSLWRQNAQARLAKRVLSAQRRRRANPFTGPRSFSISRVLREMRTRASALYDPLDELQGLHVAAWLKRLGVDEEQYVPLLLKAGVGPGGGGDVVAKLRACGDAAACLRLLERLGVDDDDAQLMATNLFAAQTLRDAKRRRAQLQTLLRVHRADARRASFVLTQRRHAQQARDDVAEQLEDVLREAGEFRHPPKALRDKRERLSAQLELAQEAAAAATLTHETMARRSAQRSTAIAALQHELARHERDEASALYSLQNFGVARELECVARELFLRKFPGLEARALAFVGALAGGEVSTWQLLRFFERHATVSQVKTAMPSLTYFKYATDVQRYDHARFLACGDALQYGFERLGELLAIPVDAMVIASSPGGGSGDLLAAMVLATIGGAHRAKQPRDRAVVWTEGLRALERVDAVATRVQTHWRRRAARRVMQMLRSARLERQRRDAYLAEVRADYVRPIWQDERDREKREYAQWLADEALLAREEALQATLRFPWREEWDDASQCGVVFRVRVDASDGGSSAQYEYAADRPVYTVAEEDAVVRMQALARRFLARLELRDRQRAKRRADKRRRMESQWAAKAGERSQALTLRLRIGVATDERVSRWLGHRQTQRQHATVKLTGGPPPSRRCRKAAVDDDDAGEKRKLQDAAAVEQFDKQLAAASVVQQCEATYHRSVRGEHRRHVLFPAPNGHAQATLAFLAATRTLQRALACTSHADAALAYTRGALPFGWREVALAGEQQRGYFADTRTQATSWDRPQYAFEHEFAAVQIQSVARVALARAARVRELDEISLVRDVHATLARAARVGWVGYGLEGLSAPVFLSRLGLARHIATTLGSPPLSLDELLRIPEPKLKKLGWTNEDVATLAGSAPPRDRRRCPRTDCRTTLAPTAKHAFSVLPTERAVQQLVAQSLPNQQGRVVGLVRAVCQSTTPISYRQLEMHLRLYAGRPDDAVAHIHEIASLAFATQPPHEAQILELFLRGVERCVALAANLRLRGLHEELSTALRVAAALLQPSHKDHGRAADETAALLALRVLASRATPLAASSASRAPIASLAAAARRRLAEAPAKGLWEHDAASSPLAPAQVARFLRGEALERVLLWWRSAALCQAAFRMHTVRQWYRAVVAFRAHTATVVQCAWRSYCAREATRLLQSQQRAPYEQRVDRATQSFFFVYTPTREKLLDEPRDASGAVLPFRPMVRDRVTSRWVQAWPHLDKSAPPKQRPDDDDDDDDGAAPCRACHAERAVRRCLECVSAAGDYVDLCLACFCDAHGDGGGLAWHAFAPLHRAATRAFHCVECRRFSTVRCLACREHYCERCFARVHRKGHTRARHACEHYDARAAVCAECEARVALSQCLACGDALCEDCMARTHARGAKQLHARALLRQSVGAGHVYCEQCRARRGDATCAFCAAALCQLCLADPRKHGAACPETQLQLKKKELLGDRLCVECGKPADRACARCGDKYCSVKWMGNPGCFERFHWRGKRADHAWAPLAAGAAAAASEMPREILELEEKVRHKRRRDAEEAEREARAMAAALEVDAQAARTTPSATTRKTKKRASKRRLVCAVEHCGRATLSAALAVCGAHLTSQHALEATQGDPLEAAKLLVLVERHGGRLLLPTSDRGKWAKPRVEATSRRGKRGAKAEKATP